MSAVAQQQTYSDSHVDLSRYWLSFATPARMPLSEWADEYRYLSLESNPTGGRWRTSTVPYLREIMDVMSDEEHEEVVVMAPSQFGKSETELNFVGYIMDRDPGPILLIQETVDNARAWAKDRLVPMLRDTPRLRGKISTARGKTAAEDVTSNEALHKSFPGGHITAVGSNSGAGLSMRPIRYVLADECDAWEPSAGKEGDQLDLATTRTLWFYNRKVVVISSPREKATSRIESRYLASDQRRLFVPCWQCGFYQELVFEEMKWEKGKDELPIAESVHFPCVQCGARIEDQHRHAMLGACEWRAKFPGRLRVGFWTWAAFCPPIAWVQIARQFVESHRNPEKFRVFWNTKLARTWEEKADAPVWESIRDRAEPVPQWTVPHNVGFLTVGADVQGDRIEFSVWGWGPGEESFLIGHDVVYGNTDSEDPFLEFEKKAFTSLLQLTRNRSLTPLLACVDTGYNSQEVYWFARPREHIYAIKGGPPQSGVVSTPSWVDIDYRGRKIKSGVQLYTLGVHKIKKTLYGRLRLTKPGPRYIHFPHDLPDEYYRQLTAEKLIRKHEDGTPKEEFKKTYANECLDCAAYAYGGAVLAGVSDPRTPWHELCPGTVPAATTVAVQQPAPDAAARAVAAAQAARVRGVRGGGGIMTRLLRG